MATLKKDARKAKLQDRELNQEHVQGPKIGGCRSDEMRTAADLEELAATLAPFRRDELEQIPIIPTGAHLEQGAVYLDLRNPAAGPVRATADVIAAPENLYVPETKVCFESWNRLLAIFSEQERPEGHSRISEELIDQTLADSFPASDPPSWNMGGEPRPDKQRPH